ncbi:anti-repressor SinI family protein [Niallia taxi]|uniref:DNA-binding anti-repressor SinI n=1 Tax=Niallia circulans TaxID=1397 RepID=A0A553SPX5_NIACI|nr:MULTISPECIES: anti-repressor SinI family protein [Niallia]MCT2343750.1 anti-repressor SinI family protein [Niallia taxi]MDE5055546.1 anti-repressor SinI family protein [Niallia taxi]MED3965379.1 anti-repressor SinI family protein [Niallia taxi]TRZ39028.1 DNA-binding anti-repressor SinI [Niallia circulans]WOD64743.1 anti-repressor SinI family protein [Niallia taxi]
MEEKLVVEELDTEWIQLMKEAKKIGLDIKDVRNFINND